MDLYDIMERRSYMAILLLGLGGLMLLLDILNPLTDFLKTWNIAYVMAHFFPFLAPTAPAYIALGYKVDREDTLRLFFACLWIPIIHYLLKGVLMLYLISTDPNLLGTMGSEIGWWLQDWKGFSLFYFGSFPLFVVTVWAFSVTFMTFAVFLLRPVVVEIKKIISSLHNREEDH